MKMNTIANIVNIEYKEKRGSGFILPTINKDCMFLITAHHVLDYEDVVDDSKLKLKDTEKSEICIEVLEKQIVHGNNDFCVLKLKYTSGYILPIITSPDYKEKMMLYGFPDELSETISFFHYYHCIAETVNDTTSFCAKIEETLINGNISEHDLIEGVSGGPFINEINEEIYFMGIETETSTTHTSYNLIEGISGIHIVKFIFDFYYKDMCLEIGEIFKIDQPSRIKKKHYPKPSNRIIDRKVILYEHIQESNYNNYFDKAADLLSVCIREKYVVLLGDAGTGKTIELKYLVSEAENKGYYPLLVYLSDYSDEDIEVLIKNEYPDTNIPLMLVFDAFDELSEDLRDKFARKISSWVKSRKRETVVVISVRDIFYKFSNKDKKGAIFSQKDNISFKEYGLIPLLDEEIEEFLNSNGINTKELLPQIKIKGIYDLATNPFYLTLIIDFYNKERILPDKGTLWEKVIEFSFKRDDQKYCNPSVIDEHMPEIKELLTHFAISMQLSNNKNKMSKENYHLYFDKNERSLLSYSSLITKKNNDEWTFEHNNFREYLSAVFLSNLEFEEVKKIICYDSECTNVNAGWINIISFLIPIYNDKKRLIDWLIEYSPEIFIKFEDYNIDIEQKNDIFKGIFEYYSNKELHITHSMNYFKELVSFSESLKTLEFLISCLKSDNEIRIINAVLLLPSFNSLYDRDEEVKMALSNVVRNNTLNDYLVGKAIQAIAELGLESEDITKEIIDIWKNNLDLSYYAFSLVKYITVANLQDEHIELLLQIMENAYNDKSDYIINIKIDVMEAVASLIDINSILIALNYYIDHGIDSYDMKYIVPLFNAIEPYIAYDSNYSEQVIRLYMEALLRYETLICKEFKRIIISSKTEIKVAEYFLMNYGVSVSLNVITDFLDEFNDNKSVYDILMNKYCESPDKYKCFISYIHSYGDKESEVYKYIMKDLKDIEELLTPKQKYSQMESIRKNERQEYFNALFDINEFKKLFDELLELVENKNIKSKDLFTEFHSHLNYNSPRYTILYEVIMIIHHVCSDEDEIVLFWDYIKEWDTFAIIAIQRFLVNNKKTVSFSDDQKKYIREYCELLYSKSNFWCDIQNKDDGIHYSGAIYLFCFFSRYLNIEYEKDIYKRMTVFPKHLVDISLSNSANKSVISEYITDHLTKEELKECICDNLKIGKLCKWSLIEHIEYCAENEYDFALESADRVCRDYNYSSYDKQKALKYIASIKNDQEYDYLYSNYLGIDDSKLLEALINLTIQQKSTKLKLKLEEKNKSCEDKTTYLSELIMLQSVYGLETYYNIAKKNNSLPDMQGDVSPITEKIRNIDNIDCIEVLIKLKDLIYQKGFVDREIFGLKNSLYYAFGNISRIYPNEVVEKIKESMQKTVSSDNTSFCNVLILEINNRLKDKETFWKEKDIKSLLEKNKRYK